MLTSPAVLHQQHCWEVCVKVQDVALSNNRDFINCLLRSVIFSFILSPRTQEGNKDTTYLSPAQTFSFKHRRVTSRKEWLKQNSDSWDTWGRRGILFLTLIKVSRQSEGSETLLQSGVTKVNVFSCWSNPVPPFNLRLFFQWHISPDSRLMKLQSTESVKKQP